MKIEYQNQTYKLTQASDKQLIFELIEDEITKTNLKELAKTLHRLEKEYKEKEQEYSEYSEYVDEFRNCGYTEEDYRFHTMCSHETNLSNQLKSIEEQKFNIYKAINLKLDEYDDEDEIQYLLELYDIDL